MSKLHQARFLITVNHLVDLPKDDLPEVAFAGRSNAGKSTAINVLCQQRRLGFAQVDFKTRDHWQGLLSNYLQTRPQLKGMVLIVDSRRGLTDLDRNMVQWFGPTGKPIHVLVTKCDKLNQSEKALVLRKVSKELKEMQEADPKFGSLSAQLFSSTKRIGLEKADEVVCQWLHLQPTTEAI